MPRRHERLGELPTEQPNSRTASLSSMTTLEIMSVINGADATVPAAVGRSLPQICLAAELVSSIVNAGGRVFYVGAGSGGRAALQDAAELPPTFGFAPGRFQVVVAGGIDAGKRAVEDAEDDTHAAPLELTKRKAGEGDAVMGITASGRTPFVISALRHASAAGCRTICLTSNAGMPVTQNVDVCIVVETGPEVIAGSTRMKAGTAQKLVLNMISSYAGIRAGRVIGNRMVGMKPTNKKLRLRAVGIVADITGCSHEKARRTLARLDYNMARAIEQLGREGVQKSKEDI